ncbi:hypothetical protein [Sphingobacterium sp. 1.A.4]|uniref:hypothetical protein n=1 Tax=Sphingobacterium sp. 1.A.4 TaxID=2044603 RepID=UPI000C0BCAA0|nr:hypothetical protein [Sphingobacterium sp. 1.A.4]
MYNTEYLRKTYKIYEYYYGNEYPEVYLKLWDILCKDNTNHIDHNLFFNLFNRHLKELIDFSDEVFGMTWREGMFHKKETFDAFKKELIEDQIRELEYLDNDRVDEFLFNSILGRETTDYEQLLRDVQNYRFNIGIKYYFKEYSDMIASATNLKVLNEFERQTNEKEPTWIFDKNISKLAQTREHVDEIDRYFERLSKQIIVKKHELSNIRRKKAETSIDPVTFEDLFEPEYKPHISKFIEILREVTPELINTNDGWIGHKNAARIYFDNLKKCGVIKPTSIEKAAHSALGSKFAGLGNSFMRKPGKPTKAEALYPDMKERIEIVKNTIRKPVVHYKKGYS